MAFNLKEYILFRTEVKRELFNSEVDTNFRMVANPWVEERVYEEGHIVYHPVVVEPGGEEIDAILLESAVDPTPVSPTGAETQSLGWWRANRRTTKGVFLLDEWDLIGGLGTGDLSVRGADGFGRILVNYTGPTGPFQTANDTLLRSPNPDATLNFVAGTGIQLQHDVTSNSIKFINTGALGEINNGLNIGTGAAEDIYAGMSGTDLQFYGLVARNIAVNDPLTVSTNLGTSNIIYNLETGLITLGELSGGAPTADELIDITYPSGMPTNGDLLQWDNSSSSWIPVSTVSLGINNIYTSNGTITDTSRTVSLDGGNTSNLIFRGNIGGFRIDNRPTGINTYRLGTSIGFPTTNRLFDIIANDINDTQVSITNTNAAGNSVLNFANTGGAFEYNIGMDIATNAFGIRTSGLGGPGNDMLNIDSSGDLFVKQLGAGVYLGGNGNEHFLPFAENQTQALDATGKLRKSTDVTYSYDGTDGSGSTAGQFQINSLDNQFTSLYATNGYKAGAWLRNIPHDYFSSGGSPAVGPFDFGVFTEVRQALDDGSTGAAPSEATIGIYNELIEREEGGKSGVIEKCNAEAWVNILNREKSIAINPDDKVYLAGFKSLLTTASATYPTEATYLYNFLAINSTDSTGAGTPNRQEYGLATIWTTASNATSTIGVFADVVNSYASEFEIDENFETWAGLFRGCIAVKQGGIVLEESASVPVCNAVTPTGEIPYEDKTLWINESTGHLMRGTVDVEVTGVGEFKYVLASSQFRVTSGTAFADELFTASPTDFSIGGNYNAGAPLVNPAGWDEKDWSSPYNILINTSGGSLSSISSDNLSCLIPVPYNLAIGQKVTLTTLSRLEKGTGVAGRIKCAIMYLDQNNFADTTGNDSTVEMLESNRFNPTLTNGTLNVYNTIIEHTLTQSISAGDYLLVGFGNASFNSGSTDYLTVNWTLSCSDS